MEEKKTQNLNKLGVTFSPLVATRSENHHIFHFHTIEFLHFRFSHLKELLYWLKTELQADEKIRT